MKTLVFSLTPLALGLFATPLAGEAQQAEKVYRIGSPERHYRHRCHATQEFPSGAP